MSQFSAATRVASWSFRNWSVRALTVASQSRFQTWRDAESLVSSGGEMFSVCEGGRGRCSDVESRPVGRGTLLPDILDSRRSIAAEVCGSRDGRLWLVLEVSRVLSPGRVMM